MQSGRYENSPRWMKVMQWLGVMALLTIVVLIVSGLFLPMGGVTSLKIVQLLQTVCLFIIPSILMAYLWSAQPYEWLHLSRGISWPIVLLAVVLMLVAIPGINLLAHWNEQIKLPDSMQSLEQIMKEMETQAADLTERFMQTRSIGGLIGNLLLMALLPAIGEELTFRGTLMGILSSEKDSSSSRRSVVVAIWVSAILFSAIHFQFYGFLPRMLMGALFGYALLWSGSIWLPILMHFTNNAIATISYFVMYRLHIPTESIDSLGSGETLWLGIVSLLASVLLIVKIRHSYRCK